MVSINPATGARIASYNNFGSTELDTALSAAHQAFLEWRNVPIAERAVPMRRLAALLRSGATSYADLMTSEMGKLHGEAVAEAEKCAWACDYFADNAQAMLDPEPLESDGRRAYVRFDPIGIIVAIMPWNFPFWQVFRFASSSIMAGNGALLKHAPNVTGCAVEIEQLFKEAGFPADLFRTLVVEEEQVNGIIADRRIRAVTLTGSVRAGSAVASTAGKFIKRTVLELGGSDPFIVLPDADPSTAVEIAFRARTLNCGQSCIAAKRFIVVNGSNDGRNAHPAISRSGRFADLLAERMGTLRPGDPRLPESTLAPLARRDLVTKLDRQVKESIGRGARLICGGRSPRNDELQSNGDVKLDRESFYLPTVLADVRPGMPVFDEETFGPVAAVISAEGEDDAIALANDSEFGLGSAVWTSDEVAGERIAAALDTGGVFVNGFTKSDPRLPFGGVKQSGYGRELSSFGIREFVNIKTVWVGRP